MMSEHAADERITLRTLRQWVRQGQAFAMLTCYDATTAGWLWRGGVKTMLVGDTASEFILGHDSTLPVSLDFLLQITAAVRRGAPGALVMGDMPFGSYHGSDSEAVANAARFLKEGGADLVKLEVSGYHAGLVERMSQAGIPVVAHIGARPQTVRAEGGYRAAARTRREADRLVDTAELLIERGAAALLVEAVPDQVSERLVEHAVNPRTGEPVPVIGCGAGPACHGHVVVLHDLLGLSDWQPPFAKPQADLGAKLKEAAGKWAKQVESRQYLAEGGPYTMRDE